MSRYDVARMLLLSLAVGVVVGCYSWMGVSRAVLWPLCGLVGFYGGRWMSRHHHV